MGEYELLRPIGSGAYSQVWLGRHRARGTEVAVKEIAMERLSNKLRESLLSEVDILRRIRHDNVIALHDSIKVPRSWLAAPFDVARDLLCYRWICKVLVLVGSDCRLMFEIEEFLR